MIATQVVLIRRIVLIVLLVVVILAAVLLGMSRGGSPGRFVTGPVDLTRWTSLMYRLPAGGQEYANWLLSDDKQTATQTINGDPTIYLSDRVLDRTRISGTWQVEAVSDDDLIGFVFAYRNPGQFYIFDWKGGSQSDGVTGMAKQGMSVKVVSIPYAGPASGKLEPGKPFQGKDLWHTEGTPGRVRLLDHEPTEGWRRDRPYTFDLEFRPGVFRIAVRDAGRVIYNKIHRDGTYRSGRFGFYNYSQGDVVYRGFSTSVIPGAAGGRGLLILLIVLAVILLLAIVVTEVITWRRAQLAAGRP